MNDNGGASSLAAVGTIVVSEVAPPLCAFTSAQTADPHPTGTLVKTIEDATIYLIQNGQRRGITSAAVLQNLYNQTNGGFDFSDVITISSNEMNSYGVPGAPISASLPSNGRSQPDGRLIKARGGSEVSIVTDGGYRRAFTSQGIFLAMGYVFCKVAQVDDYNSYTAGPPIVDYSVITNIQSDGYVVLSPLVQGPDGLLYGAGAQQYAASSGTVFSVNPNTGEIRTLHVFSGPDGSSPYGSVLFAADGSLYGTTRYGGLNSNGTVFKIKADGSFSTVHYFGPPYFSDCSLGCQPWGGLVKGSDGNLYGTTLFGGVNNSGSIFRIDSSDQFSLIHSFTSSEGTFPVAPLFSASNGTMYGTTDGGGAYGVGTIFSVTLDGVVNVLHSFAGYDAVFGTYPEGIQPQGALAEGSDGLLYGAATFGGSNVNIGGIGTGGTLFRIDPVSRVFELLHTFSWAEGVAPYAGLVRTPCGDFYGTLAHGGGSSTSGSGAGSVFKLTTAGQVEIVRMFSDIDGTWPQAGLTLGSDGALYGATILGGSSGMGVIFRLNPCDCTSALNPKIFFDGSNDPRFQNAYFGQPVIDSQGRLIVAGHHPVGYGATTRLTAISSSGTAIWQSPDLFSDSFIPWVTPLLGPQDKIYVHPASLLSKLAENQIVADDSKRVTALDSASVG